MVLALKIPYNNYALSGQVSLLCSYQIFFAISMLCKNNPLVSTLGSPPNSIYILNIIHILIRGSIAKFGPRYLASATHAQPPQAFHYGGLGDHPAKFITEIIFVSFFF